MPAGTRGPKRFAPANDRPFRATRPCPTHRDVTDLELLLSVHPANVSGNFRRYRRVARVIADYSAATVAAQRREAHVVVRLVIGLVMTVVVVAFVARRAWTIYTLIRSGQPAPDRSQDLGRRLRTQLVEVFGQKRLLKWTVPGLAHFFTFWAFVILLTVYIEAYGALFDPDFAIPLIGHSPVAGLCAGHDRRAVPALAGRVRDHPHPQRAGARAAGVALLRQPHRRGVADPVHDLQRAVDAVLLPGRLLRAGHVPLHVRGVGVDRPGQPVHRSVPRARWRSSSRSGCCCTSA